MALPSGHKHAYRLGCRGFVLKVLRFEAVYDDGAGGVAVPVVIAIIVLKILG